MFIARILQAYRYEPSLRTRVTALAVVLAFGVAASLIRLSRPDFGLFPLLRPLDFAGASPNFMVCAGMPLVAFAFREVADALEYSKTVWGVVLGLIGYEFLQHLMPRRTFDWADIIASVLGGLCSMLLGRWLFLRKAK